MSYLRRERGLSQEEVAERIGVSRQAVANGKPAPPRPIWKTALLSPSFMALPWTILLSLTRRRAGFQYLQGQTLFGIVAVGDRGQIVIPKKARDIFDIRPGDSLAILGDEDQGIAILKSEFLLSLASEIMSKRGKDR